MIDPVMQVDQDRSRPSINFDEDLGSSMDQAILINFDQLRSILLNQKCLQCTFKQTAGLS